MIYFSFNKNDHSFIFTTNKRALGEFLKMKDSKVYKILSKQSEYIDLDNFIICMTEDENIVKGKQRVIKPAEPKKKDEQSVPVEDQHEETRKNFDSFFNGAK